MIYRKIDGGELKHWIEKKCLFCEANKKEYSFDEKNNIEIFSFLARRKTKSFKMPKWLFLEQVTQQLWI